MTHCSTLLPDSQATMLRRIRCGEIEAILIAVPLGGAHARYGVFFVRNPVPGDPTSNPFFDYGDLLTLSKLAALAHSTLATLVEDREPDA